MPFKPFVPLLVAGALACLPSLTMAAPAESALRPDPQALAVIKGKAEKGDVSSQYAYGHAWLYGTYGQAIDAAKGDERLTKAAARGSAGAPIDLYRR